MNGGVKSQVRAITIQHEREEALDNFATRSHFDCLVDEWKDREGMWQQTNIGARDAEEAANTMNIQAECEGPMWWREDSRNRTCRDMTWWRGTCLVQTVLGLCAAKTGTIIC